MPCNSVEYLLLLHSSPPIRGQINEIIQSRKRTIERTAMKGKLKHGDQARIAEITGYTHDYVKKVMQGIRHNKKILEVAEELLESRAQLSNANSRQKSL